MKKILISLGFLIAFILIIINPAYILDGARYGLTLWYQALIPALFPYMILSNIIIMSGLYKDMTLITLPLCRLLRINPDTSMSIIAGLFFGYPACALNACAMERQGIIDKPNALFVSCCFNNLSPAFITGYICSGLLKNTAVIIPVLVIFYINILLSTALIRYTFFCKIPLDNYVKKFGIPDPAPHYVSEAIMRAVTAITKLGGYMVIFSILSVIIRRLLAAHLDIICAILEITTGSELILKGSYSDAVKLIIILPLLSFGGICGMCQTFGIDEDNIIDRKKYIYCKMLQSLMSLVLTLIAVYVLKIAVY